MKTFIEDGKNRTHNKGLTIQNIKEMTSDIVDEADARCNYHLTEIEN